MAIGTPKAFRRKRILQCFDLLASLIWAHYSSRTTSPVLCELFRSQPEKKVRKQVCYVFDIVRYSVVNAFGAFMFSQFQGISGY